MYDARIDIRFKMIRSNASGKVERHYRLGCIAELLKVGYQHNRIRRSKEKMNATKTLLSHEFRGVGDAH